MQVLHSLGVLMLASFLASFPGCTQLSNACVQKAGTRLLLAVCVLAEFLIVVFVIITK